MPLTGGVGTKAALIECINQRLNQRVYYVITTFIHLVSFFFKIYN